MCTIIIKFLKNSDIMKKIRFTTVIPKHDDKGFDKFKKLCMNN